MTCSVRFQWALLYICYLYQTSYYILLLIKIFHRNAHKCVIMKTHKNRYCIIIFLSIIFFILKTEVIVVQDIEQTNI